jgi:hypothetical protein
MGPPRALKVREYFVIVAHRLSKESHALQFDILGSGALASAMSKAK